MLFDHERMEINEVIRELRREVAGILREIPPGNWESKDNLERAVKSIGRNFAEAAGKWLLADKINRYQIARGSSTEGATSLDELVDFGLVGPERVLKAKELLWRIASMLTGIIRSLESLPERENAARRSVDSGAHTHARAPARARARPVPGPDDPDL